MSTEPANASAAPPAPKPGRGTAVKAPDAARLMQIEAELRAQPTAQDLTFHLVNALPQFFGAEQAIALRWKGQTAGAIAASNVPKPNLDSMWVQAVTATVSALGTDQRRTGARANLATDEKGTTALPFGLYLPLNRTSGGTPDGVVLARSRAWSDNEIAVAQYLAQVYAHAFQRSHGGAGRWWRRGRRAIGWAVLLGALAALVLIKVPSFAIAPARVTALASVAVAPATTGRVTAVLVAAGDEVAAGTPLIQLDSGLAEATLASARQALLVAEIREAQLRNMALRRPEARADLLLAEAEVALAQIDVQEAELVLDQHLLHAPIAGRVLGERLDRLTGRPVNFGDVLLTLADPTQTQVQADVALADAGFVYDLRGGRFFPNDAPFAPLSLTPQTQPAAPERDARGGVSYLLRLQFTDDTAPQPIGAEGIVQLTGPPAPLGYVLLRKPLTWVIQRLPPSWARTIQPETSNG